MVVPVAVVERDGEPTTDVRATPQQLEQLAECNHLEVAREEVTECGEPRADARDSVLRIPVVDSVKQHNHGPMTPRQLVKTAAVQEVPESRLDQALRDVYVHARTL